MKNQVVLVTGASSGIGKATAERLAVRGHKVFAAARNPQALQSIQQSNLIPITLDVTLSNSVEAAVTTTIEQAGRIDVLVNNAGYGQYGTIEETPLEKVNKQFEVNVLGMAAMTKQVLPLMRRQGSGRIVNMSSVAGKLVTPFAGWYSASKHAVEAFSDALRMEVAPFGIDVIIVEPGAIRTGFEDTAVSELDALSTLEAYQRRAAAFRRLVQGSYRSAPGPDVVAMIIHEAIEARRPRTRYAATNDAQVYIGLKRFLSDRLLDRLLMFQLRS